MRTLAMQSAVVKALVSSKRLLFMAGLVMAMILLTIAIPRLATRLSAARNFSSASAAKPQGQGGCCSNIPGTLRRMIGTFYSTEADFQSTLILNNKGPNEIAVTPILHSSVRLSQPHRSPLAANLRWKFTSMRWLLLPDSSSAPAVLNLPTPDE